MPHQFSGLLETVASWGAAAVALVGSAALLRRRLSRDRTEIAKDTAETSFVERLLLDRDSARADAREAWQAHQADVETIARLITQTDGQAKEISRLIDNFAAFQRKIGRLYPITREFLDSNRVPIKEDK